MKCEVCGRSITINWGNNHAVVCEEHRDHTEQLTQQKRQEAQQWSEGFSRHVPVEVEPTSSVLLTIWWAFFWRFILLSIVLGIGLGLVAGPVLELLQARLIFSEAVIEKLMFGIDILLSGIAVLIVLDRVIGKKTGGVRLVVVRAEPTDDK